MKKLWRDHTELSHMTPEQRFDDRYDVHDNGCWVWQGYIEKGKGGKFLIQGKRFDVSRFSYERFNGPIPEGYVVQRTCGLTSCVNPDHLRTAITSTEGRKKVGHRYVLLQRSPSTQYITKQK
jgi:hypothetical protein